MNLRMGSQTFIDVQIPVLWGTRAVIQDRKGSLSIIDLGGTKARLEILADKPAPHARFVPTFDGFSLLSTDKKEIYTYSPREKKLTSKSLELPSCRVRKDSIEVGSNVFSGGLVVGARIGIRVSKDSIAMGAGLPPNLAELVI